MKNLHAAAIRLVKGEAAGIRTQIEERLARLNSSVAEADGFIKTLSQ